MSSTTATAGTGTAGGEKYEKGDVYGITAYLKTALNIPIELEGKVDDAGSDGSLIRNATKDIVSARTVLLWLAKDVVEPCMYVHICIPTHLHL